MYGQVETVAEACSIKYPANKAERGKGARGANYFVNEHGVLII